MLQMRDVARSSGVPNVNFESAEALKDLFPELRDRGLRNDAIFAADPNSDQGKAFYRNLDQYCRAHDLAVAGIGMVSQYSHSFCFAPVSEDGMDGKLMQMDASIGGSFFDKDLQREVHTRVKPADPNHGKAFANQVRALWLVPRDIGLLAGNAKFNVAKKKLHTGVNCAEMTSGLLHHLNRLGVDDFKDVYAAHRAHRDPTGPVRHRGFASGMVLACPHMIVQHTNAAWQQWAGNTDKGAGLRGAGDEAHLHTREIEFTAGYQV